MLGIIWSFKSILSLKAYALADQIEIRCLIVQKEPWIWYSWIQNTEKQTNKRIYSKLVAEIRFRELKLTCCPPELFCLLHLKKYKTTVQKQYTQKNSSNVEWRFWVALRFLLSVRYSTSYWIHHKKTKKHCLLTILFIYIKKINNRLVFKIKRWI